MTDIDRTSVKNINRLSINTVSATRLRQKVTPKTTKRIVVPGTIAEQKLSPYFRNVSRDTKTNFYQTDKESRKQELFIKRCPGYKKCDEMSKVIKSLDISSNPNSKASIIYTGLIRHLDSINQVGVNSVNKSQTKHS